jgi:hypothetical protein
MNKSLQNLQYFFCFVANKMRFEIFDFCLLTKTSTNLEIEKLQIFKNPPKRTKRPQQEGL